MSEMDLDALERALKAANREATDQRYMAHAYRNMLGPTGLKVAEMWDKKRVSRVHFDWGPKAAEMTGEERAQFILELEDAPAREMLPGEIDAALTQAPPSR
jgi:hypothetical protein